MLRCARRYGSQFVLRHHSSSSSAMRGVSIPSSSCTTALNNSWKNYIMPLDDSNLLRNNNLKHLEKVQDHISLPFRKHMMQSQLRDISSSNLVEEFNDALELIEKQDFAIANLDRMLLVFYRLLFACIMGSNELLAELMKLWWMIASTSSENRHFLSLQKAIFEKKDTLILILMKGFRYDMYKKYIMPVYSLVNSTSVTTSWYDEFISLVQPQVTVQGEKMNQTSIMDNLNSELDSDKKRKIISSILHLRMRNLTSKDSHRVNEDLRYFIELLNLTEDKDLLLTENMHSIYLHLLACFAAPPVGVSFKDHFESIQQIISEIKGLDVNACGNFITSLMFSTMKNNPSLSLTLWEHKMMLSIGSITTTETTSLTDRDLDIAMNSHLALDQYDDAIALYDTYSNLRSDIQLETLLRIRKKSQKWDKLQQSFESMYGKGTLPHLNHYSIVMDALFNLREYEKIYELYAQMKERNIVPNSAIYSFLISSKVNQRNFNGAWEIFNEFLDALSERKCIKNSSKICSSMLANFYQNNDALGLVQFLKNLIVKQQDIGVVLVSDTLLCTAADFCGSNYKLEELEEVLRIGNELGASEKFYQTCIRAYTRLNLFQKAEDLALEAHLQSLIPYTSEAILRAQLRNYRFWIEDVKGTPKKAEIYSKANSLLNFISCQIKFENLNPGVCREIILLYINLDNLKKAEFTLAQCEKNSILNESLFGPFLKYYLHQRTFASYNNILKIYRRMAELKIKMSTKTYVPVMAALIQLDSVRDNTYSNSLKLLHAVLEMYGINLVESKVTNKSVSIDDETALNICKMLSMYTKVIISDKNNLKMIVAFLNHIKSNSNEITTEFKIMIYKLMCDIYIYRGNYKYAETLIAFANDSVYDMIKIFNNREPSSRKVPSNLISEFQKIIDIKLKILKLNSNMPEKYLEILRESKYGGIKLTAKQYEIIIDELLKKSDVRFISEILEISEEHLIDGNWIEVKLMRRLHYIYKLFILHLSNMIDENLILERFSILNQYYNVKSITSLRHELERVNINSELRVQLKKFKKHYGKLYNIRNWTIDSIIVNSGILFCPELSHSVEFKIQNHQVSKLWVSIIKTFGADRLKLYKLMDEYPETMDYMFYNGPALARMQHFRKEIDSRDSPPKGNTESNESRRFRSIKVLKSMISNLSISK